jgi:hypothetical protein
VLLSKPLQMAATPGKSFYMENLIKLVNVVAKHKQRQYPLLEFRDLDESSSMESIFFRNVRTGVVTTDEKAAQVLYGTSEKDDRYRMLKSRLKEKLLNHLYFLEFKVGIEKAVEQAEQECLQLLYQAKMLILTGEHTVAEPLVKKGLRLADRYEFTAMQIRSLEYLIRIYSHNCQPYYFRDSSQCLKEARALYAIEADASERFYFVKMLLLKSVSSRKKHNDRAVDEIADLRKLWLETKSYNIFECMFELILVHKGVTGAYTDLVQILSKLQAGEDQKIALNENRFNMARNKTLLMHAYLKSRSYKEGLRFAAIHMKDFEVGTLVWFAFIEQYFLLAVHSRDKKLASDIVHEAFDVRRIRKLTVRGKEMWKLYRAYLDLIYYRGHYLKSGYARSIRNVPDYEKNEEAYNVALLILQLVYYLCQRDHNKMKHRWKHLRRYLANYFEGNFSHRCRIFIELVGLVVEDELDDELRNKKIGKLVEKLSATAPVRNTFQEIEIVPYEDLWNYVSRMQF